jgi:hypothetical protein
LYDTVVNTPRAWLAGIGAAVVLAAGLPADATTDRLEQFRDLAASRLALAQLGAGDAGGSAVAELYALVDEEIVENLESGGPFASVAFIQDRLDAFSGAWGGASFHVLRPRGGSASGPYTIGVFSLSGVPDSGGMRIYARSGGSIGPVRTVTHDGVPEVSEWPPARDGAAQWLVTWLGPASGRGSRPVRIELWRQRGDADATRVWSSAELFPDGLAASQVALGRGEISLRYELRYPGWKPGCEGQTEHEDLYRAGADGGAPVLARRHVLNGWHRDLGSVVSSFFSALAGGDVRRLAELVPDALLRSRLPAGLRPEPACEAQSPDMPGLVVVAATDENLAAATGARASRPSSNGHAPAPWSLWWTRAGSGAWRLSAAQPVLH